MLGDVSLLPAERLDVAFSEVSSPAASRSLWLRQPGIIPYEIWESSPLVRRFAGRATSCSQRRAAPRRICRRGRTTWPRGGPLSQPPSSRGRGAVSPPSRRSCRTISCSIPLYTFTVADRAGVAVVGSNAGRRRRLSVDLVRVDLDVLDLAVRNGVRARRPSSRRGEPVSSSLMTVGCSSIPQMGPSVTTR